MIWDVHPGFFFLPGSGFRGQKSTGSRSRNIATLQVRREGGTYHDTASLVGDVPDLEARKEQDTDPDP